MGVEKTGFKNRLRITGVLEKSKLLKFIRACLIIQKKKKFTKAQILWKKRNRINKINNYISFSINFLNSALYIYIFHFFHHSLLQQIHFTLIKIQKKEKKKTKRTHSKYWAFLFQFQFQRAISNHIDKKKILYIPTHWPCIYKSKYTTNSSVSLFAICSCHQLLVFNKRKRKCRRVKEMN